MRQLSIVITSDAQLLIIMTTDRERINCQGFNSKRGLRHWNSIGWNSVFCF